jgi:hypothetical protein
MLVLVEGLVLSLGEGRKPGSNGVYMWEHTHGVKHCITSRLIGIAGSGLALFFVFCFLLADKEEVFRS